MTDLQSASAPSARQFLDIPAANARPAASFAFSPAADQSEVTHLEVTVENLWKNENGWMRLSVFSGFGFLVTVPPGLPVAIGDRLILEHPNGKSNPFVDPYTAIYPQSLQDKSKTKNSKIRLNEKGKS
jgi:hypothetical protein